MIMEHNHELPPINVETDELIVMKVLMDENGEPDLMVWTNICHPGKVLIMISTGMTVVLGDLLGEHDHE